MSKQTSETEEEETDSDRTDSGTAGRSRGAAAFMLVPVFDISQTDGEPLPEHPSRPLDDDPANAADIIRRTNQLAAAVIARGVRIIDDEPDADRGGYWSHSTQTIAIKPTTNNAARFRVLLHETAHMLANHSPKHDATRGDRETIVELAAHIAAGVLGYDTSAASIGYVATWAGADMARVKACMAEANSIARQLLDMMPDDPTPKATQAPAVKREPAPKLSAEIAARPAVETVHNFCEECGRPLDDAERHNAVCPECQTPPTTPAPTLTARQEQNRKSAEAFSARRETKRSTRKPKATHTHTEGDSIVTVTERPAKPTPSERETVNLADITADNADEMLRAAQDRKGEQLRALNYFDNPERCEREHADELRKIRLALQIVYERVTRVRNETERPVIIAETRHIDVSGQEIEGTARTIAATPKRSARKPKAEPQPTPRTDEMERQVKEGKTISLSALADAINADKAEAEQRANAEQSAEAPAATIAPRAAVLQKELKSALAAVKPAVPTRSALPILKTVRIDAKDGQITLSATNLEIGITRTVPAVVDAPFSVCFEHKQLSAAVNGRADDVIDVTPTKVGAVTLVPMDAADYPVLPAPNGPSADIDAAELAGAVNAVTHAAAKEDTRPVLAAVNMRISKGYAELAASDGFRLAVSAPVACPLPDGSILPPARAMATWAGLKMSGQIRVNVSEHRSQLFISDDRTTFVTRLIEGTFPDYKQIIPRESAVMMQLDPRQLAETCRQIAPIVKDNNDVLRLTLTYHAEHGEDRLTASGKSEQGAEIALDVPMTAVHVPHDSYTGTDSDGRPTHQIAFNVTYLADICKHAAGPLTFGLNTPQQGAKITDAINTFVLMPMVIAD